MNAPIQTLKQEAQNIDATLASMGDPATAIPALQTALTRANAEFAADPTGENKVVLHEALEQLRQAEHSAAQVNALRLRRRTLEGEIALQESTARMARIEEADRRLAECHNEFEQAARTMMRAYRRALVVAQHNRTIPGASTRLPDDFSVGLPKNTSQLIRDNSIPWLRDEEESQGDRHAA